MEGHHGSQVAAVAAGDGPDRAVHAQGMPVRQDEVEFLVVERDPAQLPLVDATNASAQRRRTFLAHDVARPNSREVFCPGAEEQNPAIGVDDEHSLAHAIQGGAQEILTRVGGRVGHGEELLVRARTSGKDSREPFACSPALSNQDVSEHGTCGG